MSEWKNSLELKESHTEPEFQKAFIELFTLRIFIKRCLITAGYKPPKILKDAINLTSAGKKWIPFIKEAVKEISLPELTYALFVKFFHHDLFIDVNTSNPEIIRKFLDAEIIGNRIKLPWIYERVLYDRFFNMFPSQTEELSYKETEQLLKDAPLGVFQIRDVLVGPFGVLGSDCFRFLMPTRTAPLWHCSDPSCEKMHPVKLSSGKSKVTEAIDFISDKSEKIEGIPSEWNSFFFAIADDSDWYSDMHPDQFPWLLVNAFSEVELKNILQRVIEQHSKEIRHKFPKAARFKNTLSGSAEKISERLNKAQCFQLILIMSDEAIAQVVEFLIKEKVINIPPTEIRYPRESYIPKNWLAINWECSQFGVRPDPKVGNVALARLKCLIRKIYEKDKLSELEWELKYIESEGESIYEKLDRYVHTEDPKHIIVDLVLNSPDNIRHAFKLLRYGWFKLPLNLEEEEHLVNKILWKLGFNIRLYPPHQRLFWERLEKFQEASRIPTTYTERNKELIRSAAVNFFVSLEEILDFSLSFATWALLSDHYGTTKFKCDFDEARRYMALRLNGRQIGSSETLELDANGKNTLYPLIQGFKVLSELCKEVIESKSGKMKHPEDNLPGFYGKAEIELFPFLHKALILDIRRGDCDRIIKFLSDITAILDRSRVCNIRNRIEHRRPSFPKQGEIEKACKDIIEVVTEMEKSGVCPLIYFYSGSKMDQYGRGCLLFKDYKGRDISICTPSQFNVCRLPFFQAPQIIFPWIHIGDSKELLRYQFVEYSDYVKMWEEYPKRKKRVQPEEIKEKYENA